MFLTVDATPVGACSTGTLAPKAPDPASSCQVLDPRGRPEITPLALARLDDCLKHQVQTRRLHLRGGHYTPERLALHQRIVTRASAGRTCIQDRAPLAILSGGPPGAGKSTWLRRHAPLTLSPNTLQIDADEIRAQLPEYQGWNAMSTQQETGDIVDRLLEGIGSPCRYDLLYDGTMTSTRRYLRLIPRLQSLGYRVFLVNVTVDQPTSQKRALERYQATGRYVPAQVIQNSFIHGPAVFRLLSTKVDGFVQVDGRDGRVLSSGGLPLPSFRPPTP